MKEKEEEKSELNDEKFLAYIKTLQELGFTDTFIKEEIESYRFIKIFGKI